MAPVAGKYTFDKEENLDAYLKAIGVPEEHIKGAIAANKQLEIKADGNEYTISSALGVRTFPLDKEVDETLPDGHVLKTTASLSGNQFTLKSVDKDGKKGQRVYEVSENGLVLSLSDERGASGKIFYKRA